MTTGTKAERAAAAALAANNGFSLISSQKLLQLYALMLKCRMIEERMRTLMEPGKRDGWYTAVAGREAAIAGAAIDLLPEDSVVSSPNHFLVDFIKGLPLNRVIAGLSLRSTDRETSGDQLTEAAGVAQCNKVKKNGKIVAVFHDGDAASIESWNQALSLAGVNRLPMLFVSSSTAQAGLESVGMQTRVNKKAAWPHRFPSITVHGSDVVAVYRVATEAIAHARRGNGATLIECTGLGSGGHAETGPIQKMEAYLSRKGLFNEGLKRETAAAFGKELDAAIATAAAKRSPASPKSAIDRLNS